MSGGVSEPYMERMALAGERDWDSEMAGLGVCGTGDRVGRREWVLRAASREGAVAGILWRFGAAASASAEEARGVGESVSVPE